MSLQILLPVQSWAFVDVVAEWFGQIVPKGGSSLSNCFSAWVWECFGKGQFWRLFGQTIQIRHQEVPGNEFGLS
jgi:hypothetical protein